MKKLFYAMPLVLLAWLSIGYYSSPAIRAQVQDLTNVCALQNITFKGEVTPVCFGGRPDDGVDDTAAITSAIAFVQAAQPYGNLYFPPGVWDVTGSGSAIFTLTHPIHVTGAGRASIIKLNASVPNTRDLFLYTGTADAAATPATFALFRDFMISGASAGVGRHGINITTPTNTYLFRLGIERIETGNLAGYAVWADQSASTTNSSTNWIRDCRFIGNGFGGVSLYDSWVLSNNVLAGTGYAVNITSVSGAGKFTLKDSNVTASSGVKIGGAAGGHANLLLENDYFETVNVYDGDSGAYVNLEGASGFSLNGPVVTHNIITVLASKGDPHALRLNYTVDANVETNWYNVNPAASYANFITANSSRAHIAADNVYIGTTMAGRLSNAGLMTSGGTKVLKILDADSTTLSNFSTLTAFDKTYVIKGGYLKAGQLVRIHAAGRYSVTGAPVLSMQIRIGAQVITAFGVTTNSGFTNAAWGLDGYAVFRTVGASATVSRSSSQYGLGATGAGANLTMNSATDLTIDAMANYSVADALNAVTLTQLNVEVVDAPN